MTTDICFASGGNIMDKIPASIFNDVIGPVMRGASSSHVAGGNRIAQLMRQSMSGKVTRAVVDFDPTGALAASHTGHGTDMGFACGLIDIAISEPYADQYERLAEEYGLEIEYRILEYGAEHPGNYRVELTDENGLVRHWEAIAIGGGMVELQKLEEFSVSIDGAFCELLVICDGGADCSGLIENVAGSPEYNIACEGDGRRLLNLKYSGSLSEETLEKVRAIVGVTDVMYLEPVLPIGARAGIKVPFITAEELLAYADEHPMEAWEYAALYESERGGISTEEVWNMMDNILSIMEGSVETGLAGTSYQDRILGTQVPKFVSAEQEGKLIPCTPINSIIKCITAIMECKSAMGLIVAAPTCGSCGCLPGTVIGFGRAYGISRDEMIKALLVAGLMGIFFAEEATFSAEVGGCQVECGAGSGFAAAAVTQMMGGTIQQCVDAASIGLQNITGLACDPVGNRVEWPCLGKNIMGGSNAVASANMALAGYDKVIPLDETIQAIYEIGKSLPLELRCTFGGLGVTKTGLEMLEKSERHFRD